MGSLLQTLNMHGLTQICALSLLASVASGLPFDPVAEVRSLKGEVIQVDAANLDINGCLVGPSGERVCPLGAYGSDGQSKVLARQAPMVTLVPSMLPVRPMTPRQRPTRNRSSSIRPGPCSRSRMPRVSLEQREDRARDLEIYQCTNKF